MTMLMTCWSEQTEWVSSAHVCVCVCVCARAHMVIWACIAN